MKHRITPLLGLVSVSFLFVAVAANSHDHSRREGHAHQAGAQTHGRHQGSVRITMEELHRHGGVPPGWTFTIPAGNPGAGRQVFIDMKCYTCHAVAGEKFPAHQRDIGEVGPDLAGMGSLHPAEYFTESIINPNAVVLVGEGHTGHDGLSRMPDYNDSLTIAQLIDLVAYLRSLQGTPAHSGSTMQHHGSGRSGHQMPGMPKKGSQ